MPRRIQKRYPHIPQRKHRLLGKNRDSPGFLHLLRIKKGIAVLYPPHFANTSGFVENPLREGSLSRIHMGQDTKTEMPCLPAIYRIFFMFRRISHENAPFYAT